MRLLSFCLLIFLIRGVASAQPTSQSDLISRGQELIQSWTSLETQNSQIYHKYLLILEHIGPIRYQNIDMESLSRASNQIGLQLTEDSRQRLNNFIRQYDPRNFSGPNQVTARRVQRIGEQAASFLNSIDGQRGYQLVQRYETDGYSVRRSLKTGMYHLGPELMRFAAAIVVVRIATCFGSNPQAILENITQWQTPEIMASHSDPVCVDELVQMLRSPIFYVGFSAFVAGNRASSAYMMGKLADWDPDWGSRTNFVAKNLVPHMAMAVGFLGDHLVKTLIQNEYLLACGGMAVAGMANGSIDQIGAVIATDTEGEETYEVRDFFGGFTDPTCRRAFNSISSDQFLNEELGIGLAGLTATAVTMAAGSSALTAIGSRMANSERLRRGANIVSRAAAGSRLALKLKQYPIVLSVSGGPIGFAVGTARMVIFLGLFEVISPYIEELYFSEVLESKVDRRTRSFADSVGAFTPGQFTILPQTICSEHYTGEQENGELPVCTRLPIVATMNTFHDFSQTWRKKHVLKEFMQSHSRWQQKVTSFINNYLMSLDLTRTLTKTREMYLNFQDALDAGQSRETIKYQDYISQSDQLQRQNINSAIEAIVSEISDPEIRQYFRQDVEMEFEKAQTDYDYESAYANRPLSDPGRRIHDLLDQLDYEAFILNTLPFGLAFQGINGDGRFPNAAELDALVWDILTFLGDPDTPPYSPIQLEDPSSPSSIMDNPFISPTRPDLLADLGMPLHLVYITKQIDVIRWYLSRPDQEANAIGLLLFQEWAPIMYGRQGRHQPQLTPSGDLYTSSRGFTSEQDELYQRINQALQYYAPILPWEMKYILSTYGELANREKTSSDGQFQESSHNFQTKSLADFVLTQLLCGQNRTYQRFFGDSGGVALQFQFPLLIEGEVCQNLVHEIHMVDESKASPFRSIFANPFGLYAGLHQSYIRYPKDNDQPLVFNQEQEAGDWWNQQIRPVALQRLDALRVEQEKMVEESFNSRLSQVEIDAPSGWRRWFGWIGSLAGGQSDVQRQAQRATSTESLTLSLVNEFYHYRLGLQHLLSVAEYEALEPDLIGLSQCLVDLINSLPEKKYRVARQQCESTLESVKFALKTRNGRYNSEEAQADLRAINETDLTQEQIQDRVLLEVWEKMNSLFIEIERYNRLVNESFNFRLDEGNQI